MVNSNRSSWAWLSQTFTFCNVFLLAEDCKVLHTTGMYSGVQGTSQQACIALIPLQIPFSCLASFLFFPTISQTHAAFVSVEDCFTSESVV